MENHSLRGEEQKMIFNTKFLNCFCVNNRLAYVVAKKMFSSNRISRHLFFYYINRFEGGEYWSPTLRKIFKELYDIEVGLGSYGGIFMGGVRPHVKVGRYCSFGIGIQRLYANHPLSDVSTHPLFHLKEFGYVKENNNPTYNLEIGNDVWVGVNAIITSKCRHIGDGAVIGAGSIVTHDLESYGIYAGNPARLIRYRFDKDTRIRILASRWFELDPDRLQGLITDFESIEEFCNKASILHEQTARKKQDAEKGNE